jgi:hypothetical protein
MIELFSSDKKQILIFTNIEDRVDNDLRMIDLSSSEFIFNLSSIINIISLTKSVCSIRFIQSDLSEMFKEFKYSKAISCSFVKFMKKYNEYK